MELPSLFESLWRLSEDDFGAKRDEVFYGGELAWLIEGVED